MGGCLGLLLPPREAAGEGGWGGGRGGDGGICVIHGLGAGNDAASGANWTPWAPARLNGCVACLRGACACDADAG